MTKEQIRVSLKKIELEKGVRILFAVESGSRAWGFESPDSDWDIRFIYVCPLEQYLKVWPSNKDVIERLDGDFDTSMGYSKGSEALHSDQSLNAGMAHSTITYKVLRDFVWAAKSV